MSYALTVGKGQLHGIPDELGNRMMMAHGSKLLLNALCPSPPRPAPPVKFRPSIIIQTDKKRRYVRVAYRPQVKTPEAVRRIIENVAEAFGIPLDWMTCSSRRKIGVLARAVAIRLIRERTWENGEPRHSTTKIGAYFNRDHATICHALDHFEDYCRQYPEIVPVYEALRG